MSKNHVILNRDEASRVAGLRTYARGFGVIIVLMISLILFFFLIIRGEYLYAAVVACIMVLAVLVVWKQVSYLQVYHDEKARPKAEFRTFHSSQFMNLKWWTRIDGETGTPPPPSLSCTVESARELLNY